MNKNTLLRIEFQALVAESSINFRAYRTIMRVYKWTKETEETRQQAPCQGTFSLTDESGLHTVKVSGFEKMTAADIRQNEGVLVDCLERKSRGGGPLEKLEVKQPRRATAKPFAIATFKSATGEILSCYRSSTAARNSVLCFVFQMPVILSSSTKEKRSGSLGENCLNSSSTRRRPSRPSRLPMSSTL